jgi:hypothetical protein
MSVAVRSTKKRPVTPSTSGAVASHAGVSAPTSGPGRVAGSSWYRSATTRSATTSATPRRLAVEPRAADDSRMGAGDRDAGAREPPGECRQEHHVHVLGVRVGDERVQHLGLAEALRVVEHQVVKVDGHLGEPDRVGSHHDEPRSAAAAGLGQAAKQQVGRQVVHRHRSWHPLGCPSVQRREERGVADHRVRWGRRDQSVGQRAHLVQQGEVGPLQHEVGIGDRVGDAVVRRLQPGVGPTHEHDGVAFRGQPAGDRLTDPVGRPGHDRSHPSLLGLTLST